MCVYAKGVSAAVLVQSGDVENAKTGQNERQSIVKTIEAIQSGVVYAEAAPQPVHNVFAYDRDSSSQTSNYGGSPETHLLSSKTAIIGGILGT